MTDHSRNDWATWADEQRQRIEAMLEHWLPEHLPGGLGPAMRYAVLEGGKRLRPLLCLATYEALQPDPAHSRPSQSQASVQVAASLELIHAYSLVHDDMPCMDNDILRRGKPTVHVQYGEAVALLVGDALQTRAFEMLAHESIQQAFALSSTALVLELAKASGAEGMCGGQAVDLSHVAKRMSQSDLESMHALKTGALLRAAVVMGGVMAQASTQEQAWLNQFGSRLGLAFQVVDDILDVTASTSTLGKTAGKDAAADKPTYVSLMGIKPAQQYATELLAELMGLLDNAPFDSTARLRQIAGWVTQRTF
jgi:farnesyl diphosphate synthase